MDHKAAKVATKLVGFALLVVFGIVLTTLLVTLAVTTKWGLLILPVAGLALLWIAAYQTEKKHNEMFD